MSVKTGCSGDFCLSATPHCPLFCAEAGSLEHMLERCLGAEDCCWAFPIHSPQARLRNFLQWEGQNCLRGPDGPADYRYDLAEWKLRLQWFYAIRQDSQALPDPLQPLPLLRLAWKATSPSGFLSSLPCIYFWDSPYPSEESVYLWSSLWIGLLR